MRPRARLAVAGVLAVAVGVPGARADSTTSISAETGVEVDSNVERVETGTGLDTATTQATVVRVGAKLDHRGRALGGGYSLVVSDLTRFLPSNEVAQENVTVLAGTARWLHAVHERPVLLGAGVTATDSIGFQTEVGARTFRNVGADGLLVLRSEDRRALTLGFGWRDFTYKPDPQFDWTGPAATVRLDMILWQPANKTKSLELVASLGFEARGFETKALINDCAPNTIADPNCTAATDLPRRDRYQRAGIEMTWVGEQIAAIGYQLALIDSNSFGQSLARHRISASGTFPANDKTFITVLAIVQLDQYLDGLVVRRDLVSQEFTNVEDENRSSLQLRIARKLGSEWSLEGRAAIWRNLGSAEMSLDFHRELLYFGLVYGK